jgi:hypothetical protein
VALCIDTYVHHDRVHRWFATLSRDRFATCVLTQGTLAWFAPLGSAVARFLVAADSCFSIFGV